MHCLILIHEFCLLFAVILIVVSVCTATGAWNWLIDPDTQKVCEFKRCCNKIRLSSDFALVFCHLSPQVSFFSSLWNHPFFTISCVTLIGLFFAGIHKRVVAPSMYPSQCWKFAGVFVVLSRSCSIEY